MRQTNSNALATAGVNNLIAIQKSATEHYVGIKHQIIA